MSTLLDAREIACTHGCEVVTRQFLDDLVKGNQRTSRRIADLEKALSVGPDWRRRVYWKLWARV